MSWQNFSTLYSGFGLASALLNEVYKIKMSNHKSTIFCDNCFPFYLSLLLEGLEVHLSSINSLVSLYIQHTGFWNYWENRENHPADQGDEDSESLQAGSSLRRAPVLVLHPPAGLQGARASLHSGSSRNTHLLFSGLLCWETSRSRAWWRD